MNEDIYDVIIIGGGPAGLSCALYTSRAKLKTVVLDKSPGAGALAVTAKIANYPGVRGEIIGEELLSTMREQAKDFGTEYVRTGVGGVLLDQEIKEVFTAEKVYKGRTVVIATGSMGRKDRVPGEEEFLGLGVSYCVTCDAPFYAGRDAAVIGDSDTALEEALFLAKFARKVILVTPREKMRAEDYLVQQAREAPNVVIVSSRELREVIGDETVTAVRVADRQGNLEDIAVDGVFVLLTGGAPLTQFLQDTVPTTMEGCIAVDGERETAIPGVYAVGDVTCNHIKQAVVAAAEGVIAALAIDKFLRKRERMKLDYK